jgi:hypothetical protein
MCCILTCMKQDYSSTHPPDWTHMVIINAQKKGLFFLCFLHKGIFARHQYLEITSAVEKLKSPV